MRPAELRFSDGSAARVSQKQLLRFRPSASSSTGSSIDASGVQVQPPALCNRMSMWPAAASASCTVRCAPGSSGTEAHDMHFRAPFAQWPCDLFRRVQRAIGEDQFGATLREAGRHRAANARPHPRDQGDAAVEAKRRHGAPAACRRADLPAEAVEHRDEALRVALEGCRTHQQHAVKGRDQHAAIETIDVQQRFERIVARAGDLRRIGRRRGREQDLDARPQLDHRPWKLMA